MFSYGPLHTDVHVSEDKLELIYSSSPRTQDVVLKTCRKWWMIGTNGERESKKSVLAGRQDYNQCQINKRKCKKIKVSELSLLKKNPYSYWVICYGADKILLFIRWLLVEVVGERFVSIGMILSFVSGSFFLLLILFTILLSVEAIRELRTQGKRQLSFYK